MSTLKFSNFITGFTGTLGKILRALLGIPKKYEIPKDWEKWLVIVLIPAYNEESSIAETIASVRNQTIFPSNIGPKVRILVIDDCSTDSTSLVAKNAGASYVLRTPKNTGTKAQAQNYALSFMSGGEGRMVVTIDADTTLKPDTLEKIVLPLQDPDVVSACGMVIPQRIRTFFERARFIAYLYDITVAKHGQSLWKTPLVSSGCLSAYRIDVLKAYGGFPHRTMVEDMDLTWIQLLDRKNGKRGQKVVLVEDAVCYPIDPHNYKVYKAQMSRWLRGFLQVIEQHKLNIFKRPGLAFFALWNLAEGMLAPLATVAAIFFLLHKGPNSIGVSYLITLWLSGVSIVIASTLIYGSKEKMLGKVITSLPCYFLIGPINAYLFWYAIWKQWILRERLVVWEKGH